ncbi:GNAT family N-acetyltransferase [Sphingomonas solaris]|uniref:GNAT family N-acetyltransferase n=1 Tax=Alterirhizorhabdus solaris TaxID=2529389 RepID=A0A558QUE2_9SPHN|nr:GNAT family N-acetyltransferase [Sphingomonas solaris]TVV70729.1 GNAT family N-acetyltransferase [Sphingomonas solaris]
MIETPRLTLRAWRDDDRDWNAAEVACPVVMEHLGGPQDRAQSDERIDRMIALQAARGHGFWVVERREDGARLGTCGLKLVDAPGAPMQGVLEVGWRFGRAHWGRGYAREAAAAALAFAFDGLGAPLVVALTSGRNTASWGLMRRLGMVRRPDLDYHDARYGERDNPTIVHVIDACAWRAG